MRSESFLKNTFLSIKFQGFYPSSPTEEYDEDSKPTGEDFLSRLCHAWEAATLVNGKPTVRTVIIRSGVVLGREGGMIKQLWLPFFMGVGGPVATGQQFLPWIHVDDLAHLIVYSIENPNVDGVLNGVAPQVRGHTQIT